MGMTRAECSDLSMTTLQVFIDGRVSRLRRAWAAGQPGSITDIYDLALLHAESVLRSYDVDGPVNGLQLRLFEEGGA